MATPFIGTEGSADSSFAHFFAVRGADTLDVLQFSFYPFYLLPVCVELIFNHNIELFLVRFQNAGPGEKCSTGCLFQHLANGLGKFLQQHRFHQESVNFRLLFYIFGNGIAKAAQ